MTSFKVKGNKERGELYYEVMLEEKKNSRLIEC